MPWTPFSAEAIWLNTEVERLIKRGQRTAAIDMIKQALEKAHREGPSNISYEEFERECNERADAMEQRQRCGCSPEVVARVKRGGTCGMGGCPYGGDL
jgi:hypothetical protein